MKTVNEVIKLRLFQDYTTFVCHLGFQDFKTMCKTDSSPLKEVESTWPPICNRCEEEVKSYLSLLKSTSTGDFMMGDIKITIGLLDYSGNKRILFQDQMIGMVDGDHYNSKKVIAKVSRILLSTIRSWSIDDCRLESFVRTFEKLTINSLLSFLMIYSVILYDSFDSI